jgi:hypothetical protein
MAKQISKSEFVQDVQSGMSKMDVAAKYEIPASIAAQFAKQCEVTFKRKIEPKYILVEDVAIQASSN